MTDESSEPLVSWLLPFHGSVPYLQETLESIFAQDYPNWELVAVSDGGSPETVESIVKAFGERVTVVDLKAAGESGLVAALNRGLLACRGEFVARIDADDVSLPERLTRQVRAMREAEGAVLIGCRAEMINEFGSSLGELPVQASRDVRGSLLRRNQVVHPGVLFRRAAVMRVGAYSPAAAGFEDYELWLRLGREGRMLVLPEVLLRYRLWGGQVSRRRPRGGVFADVFRARMGLAQELEVSRASAAFFHAAWVIGQRDWVARYFSRLRGLRE